MYDIIPFYLFNHIWNMQNYYAFNNYFILKKSKDLLTTINMSRQRVSFEINFYIKKASLEIEKKSNSFGNFSESIWKKLTNRLELLFSAIAALPNASNKTWA